MPTIVEWNSHTYYKANYYQIWRYEDAGCFNGIKYGEGYWYSVKHGWLPAIQGNGRYYSTFKTREAAQRVLDMLLERPKALETPSNLRV